MWVTDQFIQPISGKQDDKWQTYYVSMLPGWLEVITCQQVLNQQVSRISVKNIWGTHSSQGGSIWLFLNVPWLQWKRNSEVIHDKIPRECTTRPTRAFGRYHVHPGIWPPLHGAWLGLNIVTNRVSFTDFLPHIITTNVHEWQVTSVHTYDSGITNHIHK